MFFLIEFQENMKEMNVKNPAILQKEPAKLNTFKITEYIGLDKPGQGNLEKGYQTESKNLRKWWWGNDCKPVTRAIWSGMTFRSCF